jgi:hypothetical protein
MEFLMDPSIWIGLLTLVVLEIVLGIDNLVFIAITEADGQRSKTGQAEASAPHEEGEPPAAFGDEVQGLVTPLDILEQSPASFGCG